ncbi:MAG: hypothetical protein FJ280_18585 [Planctomycetes bacterium]|nr:hypothetical protein [Planctomycetota bacterium]
MGLSKRERLIVLLTILSVGALAGDRLVRAPIANRLGALRNDRDQALAQVEKAKILLQQREQVARKTVLWNDAEAESGVARALERWSREARLTLTSVTPDRMAGDKGVREIVFVVAGKGPLDALAWFLYQVETSDLPLKVKSMQIGSASEAGDSMSLELRLSTLYLAADEKSSSKPSQPRRKETNDEDLLL